MSDNLKACPSPAKRSDFSSLLGVPRRKGGDCSPPFRSCQDCSARGRRAPEGVFSEALVNKPTLIRRLGRSPVLIGDRDEQEAAKNIVLVQVKRDSRTVVQGVRRIGGTASITHDVARRTRNRCRSRRSIVGFK